MFAQVPKVLKHLRRQGTPMRAHKRRPENSNNSLSLLRHLSLFIEFPEFRILRQTGDFGDFTEMKTGEGIREPRAIRTAGSRTGRRIAVGMITNAMMIIISFIMIVYVCVYIYIYIYIYYIYTQIILIVTLYP